MSNLEGWDIGATVEAGLGLGDVTAQWGEPEESQEEGDGQTKTGGYIAMGMGSTHKGSILLYRDKLERKAALIPDCARAQVELTQRVGEPTKIQAHSDDETLNSRAACLCMIGAMSTALQMQREWDKEGYDGTMGE